MRMAKFGRDSELSHISPKTLTCCLLSASFSLAVVTTFVLSVSGMVSNHTVGLPLVRKETVWNCKGINFPFSVMLNAPETYYKGITREIMEGIISKETASIYDIVESESRCTYSRQSNFSYNYPPQNFLHAIRHGKNKSLSFGLS